MKICDGCGRAFEADPLLPFCPDCLTGTRTAGASSEPDAARSAPAGPAHPRRLPARPDFLKRYELIEKVGEGGQGAVWKVWDIEFRRFVGMKRLSRQEAASEGVLDRFFAEAQIASQLEHPGILPIFDVGLDPDGRPYYTTQLLPGATLADAWRKPGGAASAIMRGIGLLERVCEVMAHAHARGVIHRDLKPANILVGPFGEVRVIDWGSAHVLPAARSLFAESFLPPQKRPIETDRSEAVRGQLASPLATASSGQPVTLLYTPPEVLRGEAGTPGPETDVYALGVMLYELLAGRRPYARPDGALPDVEELKQLILAGPPEPVRRTRRRISKDLAAICNKAMVRSVTERYASMPALAADLRAAQEIRPVQARNPGPALRLQKWAFRHAGALALAVMVLAGIAVALSIGRSLEAQRDAARQLVAMNAAELASRSGRWRDALRLWDEAERAGYRDAVHLGLLRSEAGIVLGERERAKAQYDLLVNRADLGPRRATVLLRAGDFEMFDAGSYERGLARVREARTTGLTEAEQALADGLVADSSVEALRHFRRAAQLDPFSHAAHQHSLGLEYLMGRYEEVARHLETLKVLYPGEFSPSVQEALAHAVHGRSKEAEVTLDALKERIDPATLGLFRSGVRLAVVASENLSFDVLSGERQPTNSSQAELNSLILGLVARGALAPSGKELPAIAPAERGLREGLDGLRQFLLPLFGNRAAGIEKIKSAWRRHPEAFFAVYAAACMGESDLVTRAELYQMGVDSYSLLPGLDRVALCLAVSTQAELALSKHTNAAAARAACLANLHRAVRREDTTARECLTYFQSAFELREYELAGLFLRRSEQLKPDHPLLPKARVRLESQSGAFRRTIKLLDSMLATNANDRWAAQSRSNIVNRFMRELESVTGAGATNR